MSTSIDKMSRGSQRRLAVTRSKLMVWMFAIWLPANAMAADEAAPAPREAAAFEEGVLPFVAKYCAECHGDDQPAAQLTLTRDTTTALARDHHWTWRTVRRRVADGEMPPTDAASTPTDEERAAFVNSLDAFQRWDAQRADGDPGPALPHRLSAAEYDYSIRDLTGIDLRPARELPVDPTNEAGFDNSGESLQMTATLLKKYYDAAKRVADHLVFQPHGLSFAPHPMLSDSDRDQYCVSRIMAFYDRHSVRLEDYLIAAAMAERSETPARWQEIADSRQLSARYLQRIAAVLNGTDHDAGVLTELRNRWRAIVQNAHADDASVVAACQQLAQQVDVWVTERHAPAERPAVRGISSGSQSFILWQNRREAAQRRTCSRVDDRADVAAADAIFCNTFPDAFVVRERGLNQGRPLSAGFHLMVGYFRDDRPLYELVLDPAAQRQLDALWEELDTITRAPVRQFQDYVFFERAEPPRFLFEATFDFARSEDHDIASAAKISRLRDAYLLKARDHEASPTALLAIAEYFTSMSDAIRQIEQVQREAEPRHIDALIALARRAYRRPLADAEVQSLRDYYTQLRRDEHLTHENACRDVLVSILVSPYFCYRWEPAPAGDGIVALHDMALASRLSYFLWSSLPDEELLSLAEQGRLHEDQVLHDQVRRLCQDERCAGFSTEFLGHWLDFRRFQEHQSVDRGRYPQFDNALRQSMFEEPIRFVTDLIQRDDSVYKMLDASHTFVNPVLARHYGLTFPEPTAAARDGESLLNEKPADPLLGLAPSNAMDRGDGDDTQRSANAISDAIAPWRRVDGVDRYGRGGLLTMSVFLTKNSPGLRTSPVKRGYWVVHHVLGTSIPPPPPNVPELPKDEAAAGSQSLTALLAAHRQQTQCAACHDKFDAIGLAFEGYDPIGQRRTLDLAGFPVETASEYPDHARRDGVDGLREYLRTRRRDDFIDNLCRKSLAFAIGRQLQWSDERSVERLKQALAEHDGRFSSLIHAIVDTPAFRRQRGRDYPVAPPSLPAPAQPSEGNTQ